MGYTHYWAYAPRAVIAPDAWRKIVADVERLVEDADCPPVCLEYDDPASQPEIGPDQIFFNGKGDDGHESFQLAPAGDDFEFCKTARKPYDRLVVATLAVAREHAPDVITVSSDGSAEEWREGLEWASRVLGRTVPDPVKRERS